MLDRQPDPRPDRRPLSPSDAKSRTSGRRKGTATPPPTVTQNNERKTLESGDFSPNRKVVVSCLVTLHLLAVFAAPWGSPEPSSDLAKSISGAFAPYLQSLALDNGYRYFAPDPGPSHLVQYELLQDGNVIAQGQFPDIEKHWPRLLYHRHFMMSEMMYQLASAVPEIPPGILPNDVMSRNEQRQVVLYEERSKTLQQSVADYLLSQHPEATTVRLVGRTHNLPSQFDVQRGMELSDERLYQTVPLGEFARSQP